MCIFPLVYLGSPFVQRDIRQGLLTARSLVSLLWKAAHMGCAPARDTSHPTQNRVKVLYTQAWKTGGIPRPSQSFLWELKASEKRANHPPTHSASLELGGDEGRFPPNGKYLSWLFLQLLRIDECQLNICWEGFIRDKIRFLVKSRKAVLFCHIDFRAAQWQTHGPLMLP